MSEMEFDHPLQKIRLNYQPRLLPLLRKLKSLSFSQEAQTLNGNQDVEKLFPNSWGKPRLKLVENGKPLSGEPKRVGVVLSGGQAAGGHNVILGLADTLNQLHPESKLFGFLNGPIGIIKNVFKELQPDFLARYLNMGGFDMIGSGRTKIEKPHDLAAAAETVKSLKLDALVIIGGDDSNTNAAILSEYFLSQGINCMVNGVPKTIDGDLKLDSIETSFGFDSATKTYASTIGNIARDALSAKKAYYFIKLMGRSASHITLECALQARPNLALISEEVAKKQMTLDEVVQEIADLVDERAKAEKHYGIVLIPEGIVEFIPEFQQLIRELNLLLSRDSSFQTTLNTLEFPEEKVRSVMSHLSNESRLCYESLPIRIQLQLLMDRDPHGNVQVSKIETERLFVDMVRNELKKREEVTSREIPFSALPLFCGYEGRSCYPSNFDANYCYNLGAVSALLIEAEATGYIAYVENLDQSVENWEAGGVPLTSLLHLEERKGKVRPVIRKALVELDGAPFHYFETHRQSWRIEDAYQYPGGIQYFGDAEITDAITMTLALEKHLEHADVS